MNEKHSGGHPTWFPPNPQLRPTRIDYIVVPLEWLPDVMSTATEHVDTLGDSLDHEGAAAVLRRFHEDHERAWTAPKPMYCRNKVGDPACQAKFRELMRGFVQPPWALDVDVHHAYLTEFTQWATACAFPFDTKPKVKEFVSKKTEELLRARREARHAATHLRRIAFAMDDMPEAVHEAARALLKDWRALGREARAAMRADKKAFLEDKEVAARTTSETAGVEEVRDVM